MGKRYKKELRLFTVTRTNPKAAPEPAGVLPVEADTVVGLLPAAEEALLAAGHGCWRSLSYGPSGLVAYIEGSG